MRTLIAEDDLVSRRFLVGFLSTFSHCDQAQDGVEALDLFLTAHKAGSPYELICLDIMMPKADGLQALKGIRDLERQLSVPPQQHARIIMTTALSERHLVQTAFDNGCDAYVTKPIHTEKFSGLLTKLGITSDSRESPKRLGEARPRTDSAKDAYFQSVTPRGTHGLEVLMTTGTSIRFDFKSRLETARFSRLKNAELFQSVRTDGTHLIFEREGFVPVRISAQEFMDLVLIDRSL